MTTENTIQALRAKASAHLDGTTAAGADELAHAVENLADVAERQIVLIRRMAAAMTESERIASELAQSIRANHKRAAAQSFAEVFDALFARIFKGRQP